jgi:putative transposase
MASPSPLLCNTYYHIFNRGINRENIFIEKRNYAYFLNLYAKYIDPVAETFAYCLLRNHFHLLVKLKSAEEIEKILKVSKTFRVENYPSKMFSDFFNAYAKTINHTYERTGSLFQHPFGRVIVADDPQFFSTVVYQHQNPQKHGLIGDFRLWKFSSYEALLSDKPTRLQRSAVLQRFGGRAAFADYHSEWISEQQSNNFTQDDFD